MPVKSCVVGFLMLIFITAEAAKIPPPLDMDMIEFLGSIETDGASGQDILTAIDTELQPAMPEKPAYE